MHTVFSISNDDIAKLDDIQSRELIARLCRAELFTEGHSQAAVTWGGDQRATDGGVDVLVDTNADIEGYIKAKLT
ncbi:MAG TPA: hypothetical protein VMA74_21380, partial [Dyella sp.]|uniref:hypothetical protein n=1 Tax=Dyella sp. TaxID=1869338 RepID=UPI002BFF8F19